jgi:hypothetical protein
MAFYLALRRDPFSLALLSLGFFTCLLRFRFLSSLGSIAPHMSQFLVSFRFIVIYGKRSTHGTSVKGATETAGAIRLGESVFSPTLKLTALFIGLLH